MHGGRCTSGRAGTTARADLFFVRLRAVAISARHARGGVDQRFNDQTDYEKSDKKIYCETDGARPRGEPASRPGRPVGVARPPAGPSAVRAGRARPAHAAGPPSAVAVGRRHRAHLATRRKRLGTGDCAETADRGHPSPHRRRVGGGGADRGAWPEHAATHGHQTWHTKTLDCPVTPNAHHSHPLLPLQRVAGLRGCPSLTTSCMVMRCWRRAGCSRAQQQRCRQMAKSKTSW